MEQFLYIILIPKISKNLCHRYYLFPSLYRNNLSIDISNNPLSPHNSNTARKQNAPREKYVSNSRRNSPFLEGIVHPSSKGAIKGTKVYRARSTVAPRLGRAPVN